MVTKFCTNFCMLVTLCIISANDGILVEDRDFVGVVESIKRILISEEHKFLFCPIEKSGSSLWRQLFLRLNGDVHWYEPPWHKKLPELARRYDKEQVMAMFNDPSWTKAVFFRDPSRRLISAYLHFIKSERTTKAYLNMLKAHNLTRKWSDFWPSASRKDGISNIHWRPQTDYCGFRKFKSKFNFIGSMEHIQEHGMALLKRVGVYDRYAAEGWSLSAVIRHPKTANRVPGRFNFSSPTMYGKGDGMFADNYATHKKSASLVDKGATYLNKSVWSQIKNSEVYSIDYEIFRSLTAGPMAANAYDAYPF